MSAVLLCLWIFSCCCLMAEPMPVRVSKEAMLISPVGETSLLEEQIDYQQQLATKATLATNETLMPERHEPEPMDQDLSASGLFAYFLGIQKDVPHNVEHLPILKNERFWILMGAIILTIAGVVIKIEVTNGNPKKEAQAAAATSDGGERREHTSDDSEEEEFAKPNLLHFILTIAALYTAMLLWGITQEYVMSQPYVSGDGVVEKVPSSLALVFWNRVVAVLFLGSIMKIAQKPLYFNGFQMGSLPAVTNSLASWCQYESLKYISFALQVTVKSTKLLPVILISSLRGKKQSVFDYMEAFVLMMSLVVFGVEAEGQNNALELGGKVHGVLLLAGLVLFDAMTPHLQDVFFKSYKDLDPMSAQFSMSAFAASGLLLVQICNGMLFEMIGFVHRHPDCLLHMSILALSSTLTQYLITYTIKHYGPVSFTVIISVRQVVAVFISDVLFGHTVTPLALIAMFIVFCTIMSRAVRQYSKQVGRQLPGRQEPSDAPAGDGLIRLTSSGMNTVDTVLHHLANADGYSSLLICALAIHVNFCFYAIAQEFLATHTFQGKIFTYPMFLVAGNHTMASLFAIFALRAQNVPIFVKDLRFTILPATTNFIGTYLQHAALYLIFFPAQTLMKSLKIIPVMMVGRVLKNRTYTLLDYVEAMVITALVAFFVYDFELQPGVMLEQDAAAAAAHPELPGALLPGASPGLLTGLLESDIIKQPSSVEHNRQVITGVCMMLGYLVMDASTVNIEDVLYQQLKLDPGQMLVGMEVTSGLVAWITMIFTGELLEAGHFIMTHPDMLLFASLVGLAMAAAVGAYTCVLTIRLFGPVVFALLMLCRQIFSLVTSVLLFQHQVNWQSCLCLVIVCNLVLLASVRRVAAQVGQPKDDLHSSTPLQDSKSSEQGADAKPGP